MKSNVASYFLGRCLFLILLLSLFTGCASHYLDASLKDVRPDAVQKPAQPRPAQYLFEFQTKGVVNVRASERVKPLAKKAIEDTGLVASLSDTPTTSGAVLSVVINNISLTDSAQANAFMTGFTFGLVGTTVIDGYICTVNYIAGNGSERITKQVKHAIHTTLGSAAAPANSVKALSLNEAVETMIKQIMTKGMDELSRDPAFVSANK